MQEDAQLGTQLTVDVQALSKLSESELHLELDRRLNQNKQEFGQNEAKPADSATWNLTAAKPMGDTVDHAALQDLKSLAHDTSERFFRKFNRQMYSLVCDDTDPDNAKVRAAAGQGVQAIGYAISGAFVVSFGWLPGIATVLGVIIAKRAVKSGYEAFCESWKQQL